MKVSIFIFGCVALDAAQDPPAGETPKTAEEPGAHRDQNGKKINAGPRQE